MIVASIPESMLNLLHVTNTVVNAATFTLVVIMSVIAARHVRTSREYLEITRHYAALIAKATVDAQRKVERASDEVLKLTDSIPHPQYRTQRRPGDESR